MPKSQLEMLRDHLDRGLSITPLESLTLYGIMALSQRMGQLKRSGYPIDTRIIETPGGKHVAEYRKHFGEDLFK